MNALKGQEQLCMTLKVTEVAWSFFSPCMLLDEAEGCADTCSSANGGWSCTERRKCPILKAVW